MLLQNFELLLPKNEPCFLHLAIVKFCVLGVSECERFLTGRQIVHFQGRKHRSLVSLDLLDWNAPPLANPIRDENLVSTLLFRLFHGLLPHAR